MKVQLGAGSPPGRVASGAEGWRAVTRVLRSCGIALRDDSITTVFPADCRVCGGPMAAWSLAPVCEACVERVGPQEATLCGICGEALGMESARFAAQMGETACTMCRLVRPEFTRAVAYAAYEDEVREVLHLLKYGRMQRLAEAPLGAWIAEAFAMLSEDAAPEVMVVAVPLFPLRERQRGFNQSVVLADAAMARLRKSHPHWKLTPAHHALQRVRDTEAQFSLQPNARRRNLRGAFRVAEPATIKDREVILVDDIMTTGATARECARVLMRAGAAKVWVATLARAQAEDVTAAGIAMWQPGAVTSFAAGASALRE